MTLKKLKKIYAENIISSWESILKEKETFQKKSQRLARAACTQERYWFFRSRILYISTYQ